VEIYLRVPFAPSWHDDDGDYYYCYHHHHHHHDGVAYAWSLPVWQGSMFSEGSTF
jgi:hypothetical protein